MTEAFPPSARVRRRADYRRTQASRFRTHTRHFLVVIAQSPAQRLGVTVTKKVGNAVVRNRVKRVLREVFRRNRALFPPDTDIVFIAKQGAGALGYAQVLHEVTGIEDALMRLRKRLEPLAGAKDPSTGASS